MPWASPFCISRRSIKNPWFLFPNPLVFSSFIPTPWLVHKSLKPSGTHSCKWFEFLLWLQDDTGSFSTLLLCSLHRQCLSSSHLFNFYLWLIAWYALSRVFWFDNLYTFFAITSKAVTTAINNTGDNSSGKSIRNSLWAHIPKNDSHLFP